MTVLPPAEALRSAVTAMGWAQAPAMLSVVPAAASRLAPPSGPQAAFDALVKILAGTPSAEELRRAAADAAAVAPAAARPAARQWAKTKGESAPAAR
ncbi:MAG: dihydrolipoamide succinyltransferase, partial [Elusimicrobiota bacterium]